MSNPTFQTFRASLQSTLAAGLSTMLWSAGNPPASSTIPDDVASGFVWIDHVEMESTNHYLQNITCGVRAYVQYGQQIDPDSPDDPTPLEALALSLETVLGPAQLTSGPWFFEIQSMSFDNANGFVDAVVVGTQFSDFSTAITP